MFLHTLAHLGGRGFSAVGGFIITTLIATQLGPACMGIFGLYMVLQNLMGILDGGMAASVNRMMAIGMLGNASQTKPLRLLRAYETVNWGLALAIGVGVGAALPWVVQQWGADSAVPQTLPTLALFAGAALASRFVQTLYQNVLFGAQLHGRANGIIGFFASFRTLLITSALLFFKTDLTSVFIVLALSNTLEAMALVVLCRHQGLWHVDVTPDWPLFRKTAAFMAPLSGTSVIALLLSQTDRVIMGHFLSLEQFGIYALIATYASGLNALAYAPGNVFYPTITQALHQADAKAAAKAVTRALGLILVLVFPACLWAVFYGASISPLLFHNAPSTAAMTAPLWAPLFLACALNALDIIPFKIFLAQNRADIVFKINLLMLVVYPLGLAGAVYGFGYPAGLFALPVLSGLSLVAFLACLAGRGAEGKIFTRQIVAQSTTLFAVLAVFYASLNALISPPDSAPFLLKILYSGTPLLLASAACGGKLVLRPRRD